MARSLFPTFSSPSSPSFSLSCFLFSLFLSFLFSFFLNAQESPGEGGIIVDLREPLYCDGVLSTEKGGIIETPQIRIQALRLRYTRQTNKEEMLWTLEAEGQLIVEFGEYLFVGEKLVYDFHKKEGQIFQGRTAVEPWFFGGELLELRPDGSYLIHNAYVTTSEKQPPDWMIHAKEVLIEQEKQLKAKQVDVRLFNYRLLWIPSVRANLDSIFDSPIRYRFRWGGRQGPRFGLTYELFSWENWKTFVRFDYRLTRGPGGGIETHYRSSDRQTEFRSINYLARDASILHPHDKACYRFEGFFKKRMEEGKTTVLLTYDKISDKSMPSNYYDHDFTFDLAERTQLLVRREEEHSITNFYTRVRLNSFQTVKQELPTLAVNFKPFAIPKTGVILTNDARISYLDFKYSKYLPHHHNYASSRLEYHPTLYRAIQFGHFLTATPEVGAITILYGDSPHRNAEWLAIGEMGLRLQTQLYRYYGSLKHLVEPYANYHYYSAPTSSAHDHYIFDITDGWARLNTLSFGVKNSFYSKKELAKSLQVVSLDVYTHAFFQTNKIYQTIPKIYGTLTLFPSSTLRHTVGTAWNIEHRQLDYFNIRTEWTLSEEVALAGEYRHRSAYDWRKVDRENFFLDVFHSEKRLKHSSLSDRRDTFLLHLFYRFHPNWVLELTSRQGWNRSRQPNYFEYEIDLLTTIQTAWHLRFSFQHQENENRFAIYLNVGLQRPSFLKNK